DGSFAVDILPSMILLGFGLGLALNPMLLAAMSDVSPDQSGLASGVVNTSFMMGGALGLAVLASLAASRTDSLLRSGEGRLAAPTLGDPSATGRSLVIHFFVLLQHKDTAGLQTFLSSAFQVQRADGSSSGKQEYLANLPTANRFYLSKLSATQAGGTLVVCYL